MKYQYSHDYSRDYSRIDAMMARERRDEAMGILIAAVSTLCLVGLMLATW